MESCSHGNVHMKRLCNRLGYMNWNDADMEKIRNPVDM